MTFRGNYFGSNGKQQSKLVYPDRKQFPAISHLEVSTNHATAHHPKPAYDYLTQYQQTNYIASTSTFNASSSKPFNTHLGHKAILEQYSEQKQTYLTSQAIWQKDYKQLQKEKSILNSLYDRYPSYFGSNTSRLRRQINQAPTEPEGLPNVGNTCFLNSSLQFLYAVHQIRRKLIDSYNKFDTKYRQDCVLSLISSIFSLLQKKEQYGDYSKKRIIEQIISIFQQSDYGYKKYLQDDALKIFITIINLIDDFAFPIKDYFLVNVSYSCSCMSEPLLTSSIIFSEQQETCGKCRMPVDKEILTTSQYLLMVSKYDYDKKINGFTYQWLSKLLFKSYTLSFGHYVCVRKENGRVYELNDNTVSDISKKEQERKQKSYSPQSNKAIRLLLYRKKQ